MDQLMSRRMSATARLFVPVFALWLVASVIAGATPAIIPVAGLLLVFCLPGLAAARFLGLDRPANPALSLASVCITGYFVSTMTGILILFLIPRAYAAMLFCPIPLLIAWRLLLRKPVHTHPPDPATETGTAGTSPLQRRDMIAIILIVILALAAVLYPLANIGKTYPEGRFYRAYFNVDYLKHVAVTAHLSHAGIPPDNPYLKTDEPLHYYWFYYLFPAAVRAMNLPGVDTMDILRVLTLWSIVVFCLLLVGLIRCFTRYRTAAVAAVVCGLFASSYEGLLIFSKVRENRDPLLYGIGKFNVDAATRWFIGHPQIDGLYRTLIFTPQHLFGLMLFCLSFLVISDRFSQPGRQSPAWLWFMGLLTGLTFGFSSFIGLIGYIWLTAVTGYVLIRYRDIRTTLHIALSLAVSILILLALGILYRRPESLMFLPQSDVIARLPRFLIYNFGPLILLFPVGLFRGFRSHRFTTLNLAGILLLCMFLILYIQIQNFPTDMGIKLGLIVSFILMIFAAIGLSAPARLHRRIMLSLAVILILPAIPTLLMDIYNSGDADNARYSTFVEREDIDASLWIRDHLPVNARIQSDPYQRYEAFSLIPTFAERRTAAGDRMHARIFLSDPAVFDALDAAVGQLYREEDPVRAAALMRDIGIDYLLIGRTERELYPGVHRTFNHFVTPYRRNGVAVHSAVLAASLGEPTVTIDPVVINHPAIPADSPVQADSTVPDGLSTSAGSSVPDNSSLPDDSGVPIDPAAIKNETGSRLCHVTVPVISHDPDQAHHYVLEITLPDSGGTLIPEPVTSIVALPPGRSISQTLTFHIDSTMLTPSMLIRISLYHLPDEQDVFFQTRFPLDSAQWRYRTVQSDSARFNAGVLPPGRYRASVIFPPGSDTDRLFDTAFLRVIVASEPDAGSTADLEPDPDDPATCRPIPFKTASTAGIELELSLTGAAIPDETIITLLWLGSVHHSHPLARIDVSTGLH